MNMVLEDEWHDDLDVAKRFHDFFAFLRVFFFNSSNPWLININRFSSFFKGQTLEPRSLYEYGIRGRVA